MAVRPLTFGVRLRHGGRTLRLRQGREGAPGWVVEDVRAGGGSAGKGRAARRRDHPTLAGALRDLAETWRGRLH